MAAYFTWPDRGFRYDCRSCGACCKGHGIGIDVAGGQLVQLVARRPELAAFMRRRGDAVTAFNPRDRCWFLADDGLCRIEVEDGRAAKPASCRLFPFNRVFHVGAHMVVDFNSVICPLQTCDGDGVSHAEIAAEIASITDAAIVGTQLPADDALIERERGIAEACFAGFTPAYNAHFDREYEVMPAAQEFRALTQLPFDMPEGETLAAAVALTPSMRFNELYGPRQYLPRDRMPPVLARMWVAWLGFAALGAKLARRPLGLQELTTIWSEQAPVMHAIARWHDVPVIKPGPIELPSDAVAKQLAQMFVDNRKPKRTLGELVIKLFTTLDPVARVTTIKLADSIIRTALSAP